MITEYKARKRARHDLEHLNLDQQLNIIVNVETPHSDIDMAMWLREMIELLDRGTQ
jgi:hypothetical protein